MLIVNTEHIPGFAVKEVLGLVQGSTIESRDIGKDLLAGLKTLVGGEIVQYGKMLTQARETAIGRMEKEAEALGANAVVNLRFSTATIMHGAAEMLAYGTAVVIEKTPSEAR